MATRPQTQGRPETQGRPRTQGQTRRTALVTGGTSGIGWAVVNELAARGIGVFFCARDRDQVELTVKELRTRGFDVDGTVCDVRNQDDIDALVERASAFGPIDVLVNNAGRSGGGVTADIDDELWYDVIDTNLNSVFRVTREVLTTGGMRDRDWGRIINIASTAGKQGVVLGAPYSASKHGVVGFTKALGNELAPTGITVNAVCPGYVETPMAQRVRQGYARPTGTTEDAILRSSRPRSRSAATPPRRGRRAGRLPRHRHRRLHHRAGDQRLRRPRQLLRGAMEVVSHETGAHEITVAAPARGLRHHRRRHAVAAALPADCARRAPGRGRPDRADPDLGDRQRRAADLDLAAPARRGQPHDLVRIHARQPARLPAHRHRRHAPRRDLLLDLQHLLAGADRVRRRRRRQPGDRHRAGIPRRGAGGARAGRLARARRRHRRRGAGGHDLAPGARVDGRRELRLRGELARRRARGRPLPDLHLRDDRAAQGRAADPRQHARRLARLRCSARGHDRPAAASPSCPAPTSPTAGGSTTGR